MSSTQTTAPFPVERPGNLGRLLRWAGLGVLCLLVGAGLGVWSFGPSMIGAAFGKSRINSLNNRIQGVLEHTECELNWNKKGQVTGLRMADEGGNYLFQGNVEIPALSSEEWTAGLVPQVANLDMSEVLLSFDRDGVCSLVELLAARSGQVGHSPFLDLAHWNEAISYSGTIQTLRINDERSAADEVALSEVQFALEWDPESTGRLELTSHFEGAGEVAAHLTWNGAGASFDLGSLKGEVSIDAPSNLLGALLGVPQALSAVFGSKLMLQLTLGGEADETLGIPVYLEASGKSDYHGSFAGFFNGASWSLAKADLPEVELGGAALDPKQLALAAAVAMVEPTTTVGARLTRIGSHEGLQAMVSLLSGALPQPSSPMGLRFEDINNKNWTVDLLEFVSDVTEVHRDKPFLEGWLAASRFEVLVKSGADVSLSRVDQDSGERSGLALGPSHILWQYDPETATGTGTLATQVSQELSNEVKNSIISKLGSFILPRLGLEWSGASPFPTSLVSMQSIRFESTSTSFFQARLGEWAETFRQIYGNACNVQLTRGMHENPEAELVDSWKLEVEGLSIPLGSIGPMFFNSDRVWMQPQTVYIAMVKTGYPGGLYERFLARFMPWFLELKEPTGRGSKGEEVQVEFEDIVLEPRGDKWQITAGMVEFVNLSDATYTIKPAWRESWAAADFIIDESVEFQVSGDVVSFDTLPFPVGSMEGTIDLGAETVSLELIEKNLLLRLVEGLLKNLEEGSLLQGHLDAPKWSVPVKAGSSRPANNNSGD